MNSRHRPAAGFTAEKLSGLLLAGVWIPDAQVLAAPQDHVGVDVLRRGVGEEVNIAAIFYLMNIGQSAVILVSAPQLPHWLLNIHIAYRQHLLQREVDEPGMHHWKENRLTPRGILLDVIPEHIKILAILRAAHVGFERLALRDAENV